MRSKFDSRNEAGKINVPTAKKETVISTYNTRKIRLENEHLELAKNFISSERHVLGTVDHKIGHDDEGNEI